MVNNIFLILDFSGANIVSPQGLGVINHAPAISANKLFKKIIRVSLSLRMNSIKKAFDLKEKSSGP